MDRDGNKLVHTNIKGNDFNFFLKKVAPYRKSLTVCCEGTFNWCWLWAVGYLALYNAAFVVPVLVVFAGTYGGLRSEHLTVWLGQRAAFVKFATAILFAAFFILFVSGTLKTFG